MDYSKLGLKVGLEIHQQLATKHKLFCKCPVSKSEEFPLNFRRRLRAVSGEMGDYDPAALYEFLKGKVYIYKLDPNTSCLVELDESPPLEINREALEMTIQMCKMLKCNTVDEVHVMRKTVVDGSAVSGFQRTSIVGFDGLLKTSFGNIRIETVSLEEDSSPSVSKNKGQVEYRLDRLGIPLIEITTAPDITTPNEAKETAENIGMMLRSLNVMRGIGSIRQDINISIKQGERIEIKGFQELNKIPDVIENEIKRQVFLLDLKKELKKRGLKEINSEPKDVTKLFTKTKCNFIKKIVDAGEKVFGLVLSEFDGLLGQECSDRTFGKELSGYAGAYGYGIIHSDEDLDKYKLKEDFDNLRAELNTKENDLILIVAGEDPEQAINAVLKRAKHCLIGVPDETRVADGEGSKFSRPLPGSKRMYPETDVPPVRLDKKILSVKIPKTLIQREKELSNIIPADMSKQLVRSYYFNEYDEIINSSKIEPVLVANMFLSFYKDLSRDGYDVSKIDKNKLLQILQLIENKTIDKKALYDSLVFLLQNKSVKDIENQFKLMNENELEKIVSSTIKNNPDKNIGSLMGMIMGQIKGKSSGEQVMKLLKKLK